MQPVPESTVLRVPFCLSFFSLITLSFAFALPRFLCLSPSPARHHCLHQVRYCSLSLAQALACSGSLFLTRCFLLALTRCFSLSLSLARCFSLALARCFSLALARCFSLNSRSLFLTRCFSLALARCLSLALATALCASLSLSLSLSHTHSRHTLWVQARCELTADHRVNDN